tara:strand:+ start:160 stop:597 length:438 start_codon:yes stop_codon:yes gene_type:complete
VGPIINTVIGAAIKLGSILIVNWLEQKRQDQLMLAARDSAMMQAMLDNQIKQASDPFVKVTRRILFLIITFTMCYLMVYYAHNPQISYDVIVPKGDKSQWSFFSWIFGSSEDWKVVQLTGGLMLSSFMDLCFMVVGFYAIPSKRR